MKNAHLKAAVYIAPTPDFGSLGLNKKKGVANGYIVVPEDHPWFGLHYDDVPLPDYIHGGLTHSHGQVRSHTRWDGEVVTQNLWVIGFDTCHVGDNVIEQDLAYVWRETHRLAAMADAAAEEAMAGIPTARSMTDRSGGPAESARRDPEP